MAKYLITGSAGFIASKVAELLLEDGHTVVGVDSMNDAYDVRLKKWRLEQLDQHEAYTFHEINICDQVALRERVFQNGTFDAVFNLAARAGVRQSVEDPFVYVDANMTGTVSLLQLCEEFGVGKFLLASTSSLYGRDNEMPYNEKQDTNRPLSPYASSKKGAEAMAYTYHYLHGIDVTVFRYFTVYGPAGRPDMSLFRFTQWIAEGKPVTVFGDGKQSRDFTYVDDIARGTIAGLKKVGYEIVNLGSDTPVVLMDAIHMVEDALGKKANLEFQERHAADVEATWANISKAETLLGWRPQVSTEQGIRNTVDWYLENRDWAREIRTT